MFIVERNAQPWEVVLGKKIRQKKLLHDGTSGTILTSILEQQLLNLLLDGLNLGLDLRPLVLGDTRTQDNYLLLITGWTGSYLAAMTGLLTPQALPSACLDLTKT